MEGVRTKQNIIFLDPQTFFFLKQQCKKKIQRNLLDGEMILNK